MNKKNLVPILLVFLMLLSIGGAIVTKHWLFMFLAAELIIFHILPPFAVLLSVIAYKFKLHFWFHQYEWEKTLYKKIKVKEWKDKFPTYSENLFVIDPESKEKVIKTMIQSENVHLLLIFLSFLPIKLGKYFGNFPYMILLAIIFSACHIPFVIIQRFNLPRIINLKFKNQQK